jgi:hypothetical protein
MTTALDTQDDTRMCSACGRMVWSLADGTALPHAPDTSPGEPVVCAGTGERTLDQADVALVLAVLAGNRSTNDGAGSLP